MAVYKQRPVPLQTPFDEFGLLLGVKRFPLESNYTYRHRLLRAAANWGSSTKQGLVNAIGSEFDLRIYSTQDKYFFSLTFQPLLLDPETGDSLPFLVYVGDIQWDDYDITPSSTSYKLWKFADGTASRILELKGKTSSTLRVEYYRLEDGRARRWIDETNSEDRFFLTEVAEVPGISDVEIYELYDPAFQSTYLLDSRGLANDSFKGIVEELHRASPMLWGEWQWGKTFWDVAEEETGISHLPNIYDLDRSNLLSGDFEAGVGGGSDCSVLGIYNAPSGPQHPWIRHGYFHLAGNEFFLFARKGTLPSGDFYSARTPVLLTLDPAGDDNYNSPFGRLWIRGQGGKLRQFVDLSGSWGSYLPSIDTEPVDPWFSIDISGVLSLSGSLSIYDVSLEYDTVEEYLAPINLNPLQEANRGNKFLVVRELPISGEVLNLSYADLYTKREESAIYDILDKTDSPIYPDTDITIRADVVDLLGTPVEHDNTTVRLSLNYGTTHIVTVDKTPMPGGMIYHTFSRVADRAATNPKDFILSGQIIHDGIIMGTDEINIPLGIEA